MIVVTLDVVTPVPCFGQRVLMNCCSHVLSTHPLLTPSNSCRPSFSFLLLPFLFVPCSFLTSLLLVSSVAPFVVFLVLLLRYINL